MFMGEYSHTIDAKKRLFIPAQFREELGARFIICKSAPGNTCILVYSEEEYKKRCDEIELHTTPTVQRALYEGATTVESDKSGRITITQRLFEYAELKKNVVIFGMNNHIEIWDRDKLQFEQKMGDRTPLSAELLAVLY